MKPLPETIFPQIQIFLDYLKFEKRYSPHTILAYQTDLVDFLSFLDSGFGVRDLKDFNHNLVRSWLAALHEKGISSKTLNRKISSLRSYFKYQLKTGQLVSSPMAKVISPKLSKRLPVFIKEDDIRKLTNTLNIATEDWNTLNAKMLVSLFYCTGMRLSELINLKLSQIDFNRSQVKILGKGNKERIIPLSADSIEMIHQYQKLKIDEFDIPDDSLLLTGKGKKMYPKYAYLLVKKYLGEIKTLDKRSPHILRHTFATHMMNKGADLNAVKELLGHSSLAATQVYLHNTIEKLRDVYKKAHPKA